MLPGSRSARLADVDRRGDRAGSARRPISRSTMAPAASRAMPSTLVIAARASPRFGFGLDELGGEFVLERLALGVGLGGELVARGLRGRLRLRRARRRATFRARRRRRRPAAASRSPRRCPWRCARARLDHRADLRQEATSTGNNRARRRSARTTAAARGKCWRRTAGNWRGRRPLGRLRPAVAVAGSGHRASIVS